MDPIIKQKVFEGYTHYACHPGLIFGSLSIRYTDNFAFSISTIYTAKISTKIHTLCSYTEHGISPDCSWIPLLWELRFEIHKSFYSRICEIDIKTKSVNWFLFSLFIHWRKRCVFKDDSRCQMNTFLYCSIFDIFWFGSLLKPSELTSSHGSLSGGDWFECHRQVKIAPKLGFFTKKCHQH